MKNSIPLLPQKFKRIGLTMFIPSFILGILYMINQEMFPQLKLPVFVIAGDEILGKSYAFNIMHTDLTDEIIAMVLLIGGFLLAFSKEKTEDEFVANLRLESLLWATYFNYLILALSLILLYGSAFWIVMTVNLFTILIFFILRFNYVLYRSKKQFGNEE